MKKKDFALIAHPDWLKDKNIILMSSPYVKRDAPVWVDLSVMKKSEPIGYKIEGMSMTSHTIATKVCDLKPQTQIEEEG